MIRTHTFPRRAFTMTEILVILGLIVVLAALLLPALATLRQGGDLAVSMSRMRQIHTFMQTYQQDNRDAILPSQFDYGYEVGGDPVYPYPGKVRSTLGPDALGNPLEGTWTDIIWVVNGLGDDLPQDLGGPGAPYRYDSPDSRFAEALGGWDNPFRSAGPNTRSFCGLPPGSPPRPFGDGAGADEIGYAGFFAANDFFNARPTAPNRVLPDGTEVVTPTAGRWYTAGQIRHPERSMYLVDSWAGETIGHAGTSGTMTDSFSEAFDNDTLVPCPSGGQQVLCEVDFRYTNVCAMLFLDGHVAPEGEWKDLADLEDNRGIRVTNLDLAR